MGLGVAEIGVPRVGVPGWVLCDRECWGACAVSLSHPRPVDEPSAGGDSGSIASRGANSTSL